MIISVENLKKLEGIKVEAQVVLEKLSQKIHKSYMQFLNRQRVKRFERIKYYRFQQGKVLDEAYILADKLDDAIEELKDEAWLIVATLDLHDRFEK